MVLVALRKPFLLNIARGTTNQGIDSIDLINLTKVSDGHPDPKIGPQIPGSEKNYSLRDNGTLHDN